MNIKGSRARLQTSLEDLASTNKPFQSLSMTVCVCKWVLYIKLPPNWLISGKGSRTRSQAGVIYRVCVCVKCISRNYHHTIWCTFVATGTDLRHCWYIGWSRTKFMTVRQRLRMYSATENKPQDSKTQAEEGVTHSPDGFWWILPGNISGTTMVEVQEAWYPTGKYPGFGAIQENHLYHSFIKYPIVQIEAPSRLSK